MFVFRECSKFTSVFTLCALSLDRFLATYHHPELHPHPDLHLHFDLDLDFLLDIDPEK